MAKPEPKIALFYVPKRKGDGWNDIPKRDLTERDVARLSGFQLANATAPGPNGDPPIYQASKPTVKKAKETKETATSAAASATADKE